MAKARQIRLDGLLVEHRFFDSRDEALRAIMAREVHVGVFEHTNIETADPADLGAPFDVLVADLSFIGLAQLAPALARL